ncbi:hypothetical protein AB0N05_31870 [Nocardia sp. NPDC051030]|uniref:hypothetical protein n=1 Tax=Nocardia sp. NPDC051030 TaxID=3155162 RepID=UPI00341620E8
MRKGLVLPGLLAVVIALAPTAGAAPGTINVNGERFDDPSGCVDVAQVSGNLEIHNDTSGPVTVFTHHGCAGDVTGVVPEGSVNTFFGASISA